jgi:hypothetical protein
VESPLSACADNAMTPQKRVEKVCVQTWIDPKCGRQITV